ncbi:isoprenyl transferase [Fodinicurvata fenggangensis]|uniref:isoprenyl transferase n=1 Tax=Fodinicurvata fenggangensis TaxID=1121830 RepID=UPI00047BB84F|nr:isoprenyl transferase [Fodinicurvata fenggangensis]
MTAQPFSLHANCPRHVAIIMDGNGRWATQRGRPRKLGHLQGAEAARKIVRVASEVGLSYLTLFAFSSENWRRPGSEVSELMSLLQRYLGGEHRQELEELGIRLRVIGQRERLPESTLRQIERIEDETAHHKGLSVVIAISYGGRVEIATAARRLAQKVQDGELDPGEINETLLERYLETNAIPDPDLLIRTGGEKRISNFLLWQLAYAEMVFSDCLWPDFDRDAFLAALEEYQMRERRYGALVSTG